MKIAKNINSEIKVFSSRAHIPNYDKELNITGLNNKSTTELIQYGYFEVKEYPLANGQRYGKLLPKHFISSRFVVPVEGVAVVKLDNSENLPSQDAISAALKPIQFKELQKTDWYIIRNIETGVEIPAEILEERAAIRARK